MTTEEIKKDDSTSVLSSEVAALLQVSKANTESISNLTKGQEAILEALKKTDANPVDHGAESGEKTKVSDSVDVGDKAKTDSPSYAPDGDAQAGNSGKSEAGKNSQGDGTSDAGTGSVKKSDGEDKKEDKKEEVKKQDDSEGKKDDYMKKSVAPDGLEYEQIAKSRPLHKAMPDTPEGAPTGAQVLDQINKGWGGKHTSYEQSFIEAMNRLEKGEFGSGIPDGGN